MKKIKQDIPTSRKITKTDLAKFLFAWELKPELVSLGGQKNFIAFMEYIEESELNIDQDYFKTAIAKTLFFKDTQKICRKAFEAFQGNIANYTVSIFAKMYLDKINFKMIWDKQGLSEELKIYITKLAHQVKTELDNSAGEKMLSEWAKKRQCWEEIQNINFDKGPSSIPEFN